MQKTATTTTKPTTNLNSQKRLKNIRNENEYNLEIIIQSTTTTKYSECKLGV